MIKFLALFIDLGQPNLEQSKNKDLNNNFFLGKLPFHIS